jgi:hypothetical protein
MPGSGETHVINEINTGTWTVSDVRPYNSAPATLVQKGQTFQAVNIGFQAMFFQTPAWLAWYELAVLTSSTCEGRDECAVRKTKNQEIDDSANRIFWIAVVRHPCRRSADTDCANPTIVPPVLLPCPATRQFDIQRACWANPKVFLRHIRRYSWSEEWSDSYPTLVHRMSHHCVCELEDSWYIHSTIDTLTSDFTARRFLIAGNLPRSWGS